MRPSHKMQDRNFPTLGYCIVCLDPAQTDLTKEHIIPDAIGGTLRFMKSVCRRCAEFGNKRFEQPTLSTALLVPRLLLQIRSRTTRTLPPVVRGDYTMTPAEERLLEYFGPDRYPKVLVFMKLPPPGILSGVDASGGMKGLGITIYRIDHWFPRAEFVDPDITATVPMMEGVFERSLAKMAYFFAVAVKGINSFDGSQIRSLLMDEREDCRNFVGSPIVKEARKGQDLHRLSLRIRPGQMLTVIVHLFASYGVAPYEVVVGKLK